MSSNEKIIKSRQQQKTDVSTSWKIAGDNGFIPKKGEIIVYGTYDSNNNKVADRPRLKVGDGISNVNDLPFAVDNDVFYFSFTAVLDELPEDRLFTAPYEEEFNIQLLDCSVEDLFYAANTYKHVVGLFSFEADGITETECLHLIHKSTALLFKGESFLGSGMGLLGTATPAIDSALVIEPADSGCLTRYARCGFDKKIVFINTDLDALLTDQSLYDAITEKFLAYRTLGIDVGLSAEGTQLFLVEHSDDCTVFKSLPLTNGLCVIVTLDHTTRRIQASVAPAIDVSMRKPDEIAGGAAGAQLLISWYDGDIYSTASSEFTLQDIINLQDGVAGLAHNIKDADGVGSLLQTKDTESWNPTNPQVIDYIADNVGTADDGHKIQVNDNGSIKVGSYGKFATSLNGKSQSLGKKSFTSGSKNIAFESNSHAEGNETFAAGKHSHAEGNTTSALGNASHAEGLNTKAGGEHSHAEGGATEALGEESHAEGYGTHANGPHSHAEGYGTTASGQRAHAEGYLTRASGDMSHAEGVSSTASGHGSHAEGLSEAKGNFAHAEGSSWAYGNDSHAEGSQTHADGVASHAEGSSTSATAYAAHAEGMNTVASAPYQHVQGKYNKADTTSAFIIGNGDGPEEQTRKNAMTVDWDGNGKFAGDVTTGSGNSINGLAAMIGDIDTALDNIISIQESYLIPNGDEVSY